MTAAPSGHASPWGRALLIVGLVLTAPFAAPDLNKTQGLAQQRNCARAADTVGAWRQLIEEARGLPDSDKLNKVNAFFNRRMLIQTDLEIWRQEDYWATPLEFMGRGTGDCEDFTIDKYITLQMLGVGNEHLRLIYVRAKSDSTGSVARMVLGYYPQPTDEPLSLDNLISSVRAASQRSGLVPIYSFDNEGLRAAGATTSAANPITRLSRWSDVLDRMHQDGV